MDENDRGNMNFLKDYAKYSSLVIQMIALAAMGVLGGIQMDKWMKMTKPIFTISLTVIMTLVALFHLFRTLLRK
jgi:hypothetical protein